MQIDVDMHLARSHVDFGSVAPGSAVLTDTHAIDVDRDFIGIVGSDFRRHGTQRADDTTPVRIIAEDGAFQQIGCRYRTTASKRRIFRGGAGHLDTDVMARAFTVSDNLTCQGGSRLRHKLVELVGIRFDTGCSRRKQKHGVVSGHATVNVNAVERHFHSSVQSCLKLSRAYHGIRGDHAQHGGQLRRDHA